MRVVLDTNVVVAGLRSDLGASRRLLERALDRRYLLLLSVPLLVEYEAVLTRPEQRRASRLTVREIGIVLDALAAVGKAVRLSFLWRPTLPDAADDMVLETAVNGRAELLVTFDLRHFATAERFEIAVVSPAEALHRLETEHEEE